MAEPIQQIPPQTLRQRLQAPGAPHLIDVRNPAEIAAEGAIEGAQLIPLHELPQRLGEVQKDQEIVCVCKMGGRSTQAAGFLRQHGYRAASLAGGMMAWTSAGLPVKR